MPAYDRANDSYKVQVTSGGTGGGTVATNNNSILQIKEASIASGVLNADVTFSANASIVQLLIHANANVTNALTVTLKDYIDSKYSTVLYKTSVTWTDICITFDPAQFVILNDSINLSCTNSSNATIGYKFIYQ